MGPKRKSSSSATTATTAGSGNSALDRDAAIATNEDELRKRVEEAEAQLREEAKIIERMTRDNRAKQDQILQMETMLQREIEKHEAALHMHEDEALTQRQQSDHELAVLRRKVSQLELHVESYDVLESSSHALRERVDKLMQQLEEENRCHAEEIHKVRLDMFNHKMALEKTFRKALQELDAEYLKKAFNAMSEESKNALVANAKLKDELTLQSIGVDNLMQRFTSQAKHYQQMKIENEILEQESQLRLQQVASVKKTQLHATRTIEKLKHDVANEEHEWKQHATKLLDELRQENHHLHKLHEAAQRRCHKWKTRCLELAERETKRRMEEQRVQTAPDVASLLRTQSQPVVGIGGAMATATTTVVDPLQSVMLRNFDEMWSASHNSTTSSSTKTKTQSDTRPQSHRQTTAAVVEPTPVLAASSVGLRARTAVSIVAGSGRKPHRLSPAVLPRTGQTMEFNFAQC